MDQLKVRLTSRTSFWKEDGRSVVRTKGTPTMPLCEVEAQREPRARGVARQRPRKKEGEDETIEKASNVGDRGQRAPRGVCGGGLGGKHHVPRRPVRGHRTERPDHRGYW